MCAKPTSLAFDKWLVVLLAMHAVLLSFAAFRDSPTYDEIQHVPAGIMHWETGRFNFGYTNPPLPRLIATLPLLALRHSVDWENVSQDTPHGHWDVGQKFAELNRSRFITMVRIARHVCILFSLLCAFTCYKWAAAIADNKSAGLLAAALWCFSPMVLGHGHLATVDIASTAFGMLACYSLSIWIQSHSWQSALISSVAIGVACLCKFTWLLLPILVLVIGCNLGITCFAQSLFVTAITLIVVNVGYGFDQTLLSLADYREMGKLAFLPSIDGVEPYLLIPFPKYFIFGIDELKAFVDSKPRSFLNGEWHRGGWWYYYVIGMVYKTTIGFQLAAFLAAVLTWVYWKHINWKSLFPLMIGVLYLACLSAETGVGHHLRYVLPVWPIVFTWVGGTVIRCCSYCIAYAYPLALLVVWHIASSLSTFPHNISYFNEICGGPLAGHKYLLNSNLDWGQDLFYLKRWIEDESLQGVIGFAYFGTLHPKFASIEFEALEPESLTQYGGESVVAISANFLYGYQKRLHGPEQPTFLDGMKLESLRRTEPIARAGYSIILFDFTKHNRLKNDTSE